MLVREMTVRRESRKSSQGQQVQDQATATAYERSADGKSTEHISVTGVTSCSLHQKPFKLNTGIH